MPNIFHNRKTIYRIWQNKSSLFTSEREGVEFSPFFIVSAWFLLERWRNFSESDLICNIINHEKNHHLRLYLKAYVHISGIFPRSEFGQKLLFWCFSELHKFQETFPLLISNRAKELCNAVSFCRVSLQWKQWKYGICRDFPGRRPLEYVFTSIEKNLSWIMNIKCSLKLLNSSERFQWLWINHIVDA